MALLLPWLSFHPASVHLPHFCGRPPSVLFGQMTAWVWLAVIMVCKYLKGKGEKLFTGEFPRWELRVSKGMAPELVGVRLEQGEGGWDGKMCRWYCGPEYIINPLQVDRDCGTSISFIPGSAWKNRFSLTSGSAGRETGKRGWEKRQRHWNYNRGEIWALTQLELVTWCLHLDANRDCSI